MASYHRTQILLENWQYDALRSLSERAGRSVSSLLRDWISRELESVSDAGDIEELSGIGRRRGSRVRHDQVLYRRRKRG